jgi:4-amino-4-deoxy-L-arabinose transferase-like glycosyltransferase
MKTQSTDKTWQNTLGNFLLPIVIASIFLAFTFSYYPFREKLQFDTDEGLNLMRSMLVVLGHPLYREVSSDQPPLFTHLLGFLLRVVGFEVNPARLLVLLFATLLVWSGAQFLQFTWGKLAAILFLPLASMVPRYLELSVSVMIGVPSIALAAVSMLFVTLWHQQRSSLWLALSGFTLALSVLIKLFTGFLVPIFLIGVTASAYFDGREEGFSWKMLRPALIWSICFAGVVILLGLALVGPQNIWLIIFPHIAASTVEEFQGAGNTINIQLRAAAPLIYLGLFGALVSIYKRNWPGLYPLAWSALAYLLLSFHSPVFYHHQLLITIPLAMMAAAAVAEGILAIVRLRRSSDLVRLETLLGVGALIGFVLVSSHYLPVLDKELSNSPRISDFTLRATPGKLKVIRTMNEYIDRTNWIMTDMPMYAFRVQRPVPPSLATFSSKRLATGSLTDKDILAAMKEYHPEQVLMARFVIPALEAYLQENYTLILSEEFFRLFVRNDLKPVTK